MTQEKRLIALRVQLKQQNLQGFLVPRADEFLGEYVPAAGERLTWITGFKGSAGIAAILPQAALMMTDSRYDLQVREETHPALFDVRIGRAMKDMVDWIAGHCQAGDCIGYDARLHTPAQIRELDKLLRKYSITLQPVATNPLDAIWTDRPAPPMAMVQVFPEEIAGRSARDKRDDIAGIAREAGADSVILTAADSIAWLLNIRGDDVPHTPFALSYAFLHDDGAVDWFIDAQKISPDVHAHLGNQVRVLPPETLQQEIEALAGKAVMFDARRSAIWFHERLLAAGAKIVDAEDPCLLPKACKTPQEQAAIRAAHLRDGVAVTKFLCWLDNHGGEGLSEVDVADKLLELRRQQDKFRDTSFDTIAGWAANGAIVHYRATPEKHAMIAPPGLLLLDSGAQYADGTTDITRTIALGTPTAEMIKAFTLVLKGHIGIARLVFPKGQAGQHIDILARQALWQHGMDYGHGTGHGVGCYLSVHEEGGSFSSLADRPLAEGMVISNEPGFYKAGEFGIRIENLVLVVAAPAIDGRPAFRFETLTLAPIDRRLIDCQLLDKSEIAWLDAYHQHVKTSLSPYLEDTEREWLEKTIIPQIHV